MSLSPRLKAVADMVTSKNRVCDVGCDHGYLPIYLVRQKISPKVLAMDVKEGPLGHARENVRKAGLEDYITLRLSDGLGGFAAGEAETLVCAGMGGRLMQRILCRETAKARSFRELILQPQSELKAFRGFLREEGYSILWEDMIEEDEKFYPIIKAVPREQTAAKEENHNCRELEDRFGPVLLKRKHPVLIAYLEREREGAERLRALLEESRGSEKAAERLEEHKKETEYIEEALKLCRL